jgi:Zn-dependent peptidase ImmA (M78 family)/transcriptional regulator with XRE-family HTH domain
MSIQINPEMIVLARESRGMVQGDIARALELTQGHISKIEAGIVGLTDDQLARLAKATRYPVTLFYRSDSVYGYGSSCLYHRKRQSLPVMDLKRVLAELNILRMGIARLLRSVELQPGNVFPRMDIGDYNDSPEYVAQLVRGVWGLPPGPVKNLTQSIEAAGGIVVRCIFGTDKLDAISQWVPGMPPLFFVNREIPTDRFRFSLAHELGHVIMHQIPTADLEREADQFASEFLMPARDIGPYLHPLSIPKLAQLKPYWRVAMSAMARRAQNIGKISPRHYKTLLTQMGGARIRMQEPVQLPPEEPELLFKIIGAHRSEHGYSIAEISALVDYHENEFRQRYLQDTKRLQLIG